MADPRVWVVRANHDAEEVVGPSSVVTIGWPEMGDLSELTTRELMKRFFQNSYPDYSKPRVWVGAGQLFRFAHDIGIRDYVLTPLRATREVLIGVVAGAYAFDPRRVGPSSPNLHDVRWHAKISRDDLSVPLRNALGGLMTVFNLDGYFPEVLRLAGQDAGPVNGAADEDALSVWQYFEEVQAKADSFISDQLSQVDGFDFERLVEGLLRAMGFNTRGHGKGADQGVDIVAFPDAFGFETPRIKVQVKHRLGRATAKEVRELAGALRDDEKALFVSTGGFTAEAAKEPMRRSNLSLIDRDEFVRLLLQHYEQMDPELQSAVPLRRVYIPAPTAMVSS